MRKIVLCVLTGILMAIVTARALLPESARAAAPDGEVYGYNILNISLPVTSETAGSALLADLNGYYLFRTPTAKNEWTGALSEKNLILILADAWAAPSNPGRYSDSALYTLDRGGAAVTEVYRTDWFQGAAGSCFALLTGMIPTTADDMSALAYVGRQDIYYPYSLPRSLAREGYACSAFIRDNAQREGFETLGFDSVTVCEGSAEETVLQTLPQVTDQKPFFAFWLFEDEDCATALEALLDGLKNAGRSEDTVICVLTGAASGERARLYIYGGKTASAVSKKPCSALDVTPTLLNLFGIGYDSRFLSGLDIFASNDETGAVRAVTPVVSLYGSAFSDWVSDAGYYSSEGQIFRQTADCFDSAAEVSEYVHEVSRLVYDRYIYARKAMELNYFRIVVDEDRPAPVQSGD